MLFNSVTFGVFFAITYTLYVLLRHRMQNVLLLIASYVFYGFWDWRFLGLIITSTLVDYYCGLGIHRSNEPSIRRRYLMLSVCTNLGVLGFFKYFNFFASSFYALAMRVGWEVDPITLNVILPVGISFYTFQTMSYTIDIYRKLMLPTRNLLDLAVFVAFFPQLVAGPIERAANLLHQVETPRRLTESQFFRGIWLIFLGLFKKVFIADNLAPMVDAVFASDADPSGLRILVAIYAFAFQIYGDFAGYSDIARGLAKIMGFEIMLNFRMPYFARNVRDFWRRWHISLSTWLRDYLYITLGGGRRGTLRVYSNLMITMGLGGLWHGAAWTFVVWGIYQGILLVVHRILAPFFQRLRRLFDFAAGGLLWELARIGVTFQFVCVGWLIFRANSFTQIVDYSSRMIFELGHPGAVKQDLARLAFYVGPLLPLQVAKELSGDMHVLARLVWWKRGIVYFIMAALLAAAGAAGGRAFIYFQF
jgi:alginate O-acetyltransferase complex protein AlgI